MAEQYSMKTRESHICEVTVNSDGDKIYINPDDTTLIDRYVQLLRWFDLTGQELEQTGEEMEKKYEGRSMIVEDGEGNTSIDTEQVVDFFAIQSKFYKDAMEKVDEVFGQDVIKKYYKVDFAINPGFVPDDSSLGDFFDEISDIMNTIFGKRAEYINRKYSKNRKGRRTKQVSE